MMPAFQLSYRGLLGVMVVALVCSSVTTVAAQEAGVASEATGLGAELGVDRYALIGEPAGPPLSGDALEQSTLELSRLLRCPVCQGLSVADSPSPSALAMRIEVRELLSRGYSQEQAADYFESTYGEFVRLQPRARGLNWLVWLAPLIALLIGFALVVWLSRKSAPSHHGEEDTDLAQWRDKVRQETSS